MKLLLLLTLAAASALPASAQQQEKKPIATLTVAYTYLYADQGGYRINLSGWNTRPAVPVGRGYTIFFSNANYYGRNHKGSVNSHGFTLGLAKSVFATRARQARHLPRVRRRPQLQRRRHHPPGPGRHRRIVLHSTAPVGQPHGAARRIRLPLSPRRLAQRYQLQIRSHLPHRPPLSPITPPCSAPTPTTGTRARL